MLTAVAVLAASLPLPCGSLCSRLSSGAWQGEFSSSALVSDSSFPSGWSGQREGRAAHGRSRVAARASPGIAPLPSGGLRRRRALPETLCCRRGTSCSAAIAVVSLCRHLEPLGDSSPRLVLRAGLVPSRGTRASAKPLGHPPVTAGAWLQPALCPQGGCPSPSAAMSLAACPVAAVASSPAGRRSPLMSLLPGWGGSPPK